jgi:hypothetical protein
MIDPMTQSLQRRTPHTEERMTDKRVGLDAILIRGVHVTLFKGKLEVGVEIGDKWVNIFSEQLHDEDHLISHIIEPNGMVKP